MILIGQYFKVVSSLIIIVITLSYISYKTNQSPTVPKTKEIEKMIDKNDLEFALIRPVLQEMNKVLPGAFSESAVNMLLGILAQESAMGTFLVQRGANPTIGAKGIFQVETITHISNWNHFLRYNEKLANWVIGKAPEGAFTKKDMLLISEGKLENSPALDNALIYSLDYGLIQARLKLWTDFEPLPAANDIKAMAKYYKRVYNTPKGKATEEQFIESYNTYVIN